MHKFAWAPGAFALALAVVPNALAATDADLAEIRDQIRQLKESYEARIQALEQRLKEAEAKAAAAQNSGGGADTAPSPLHRSRPPLRRRPTSGLSAFNPAISAVLQGVYANLSQDPNQYAIHGFVPSGDIAPAKRGFSIAESELGFSANVDDKFYGNLIFSLAPDNSVEVEEAYGVFTAAPYGLAPKFGRFLLRRSVTSTTSISTSGISTTRRCPIRRFSAASSHNDGLQLKWVAPTDIFLEFGGEIGDGSGFPGTERNKNGIGGGAAYVHAGGDIGTSNSWRAGFSYLQLRPDDRQYAQTDIAGNDAQIGFSGKSQLAIADFVWKWAPNGNALDTNFKLQGEYFWRKETRRSNLRRRRGARPHQHVELLVAPERLVHRRRLSVHAVLARGRALRPTQHRNRRVRGERHLPRAGFVQSAALFGDARLDTVGVQPFPRAVAAEQDPARPDRQPALRPIHPDARRARRAQILKRLRMKSF